MCDKVVEVRRIRDRVMTVVVLEENVLSSICGYATQSDKCF